MDDTTEARRIKALRREAPNPYAGQPGGEEQPWIITLQSGTPMLLNMSTDAAVYVEEHGYSGKIRAATDEETSVYMPSSYTGFGWGSYEPPTKPNPRPPTPEEEDPVRYHESILDDDTFAGNIYDSPNTNREHSQYKADRYEFLNRHTTIDLQEKLNVVFHQMSRAELVEFLAPPESPDRYYYHTRGNFTTDELADEASNQSLGFNREELITTIMALE